MTQRTTDGITSGRQTTRPHESIRMQTPDFPSYRQNSLVQNYREFKMVRVVDFGQMTESFTGSFHVHVIHYDI